VVVVAQNGPQFGSKLATTTTTTATTAQAHQQCQSSKHAPHTIDWKRAATPPPGNRPFNQFVCGGPTAASSVRAGLSNERPLTPMRTLQTLRRQPRPPGPQKHLSRRRRVPLAGNQIYISTNQRGAAYQCCCPHGALPLVDTGLAGWLAKGPFASRLSLCF